MNATENMRKIAENIVFSYQSKISEVAMIIDNTSQILEDFKNRRTEMSNQLKEILANEESLRRKDFDNMMKDILVHQDEGEREIKNLLKTFFEEQKEIAELIKKNLTGGEKVRINDFRDRLKDIQVRQKAREDEVSHALKQFQKEYKETAELLHSLLDKGEAIRIKDFREVIKNIRSGQLEQTDELGVKREFPKGGGSKKEELVRA